MRKQVIKVNDKVRIINPEVFVRCGYPKTKEWVRDNLITEEEKNTIAKLVGHDRIAHLSGGTDYDKMLDVLVFNKLRGIEFGGKQRSIHTKIESEFAGAEAVVLSKRCVKTGFYERGYFDHVTENYEPNHLSYEKTHVILSVSVPTDFLGTAIEIEERHVQKL